MILKWHSLSSLLLLLLYYSALLYYSSVLLLYYYYYSTLISSSPLLLSSTILFWCYSEPEGCWESWDACCGVAGNVACCGFAGNVACDDVFYILSTCLLPVTMFFNILSTCLMPMMRVFIYWAPALCQWWGFLCTTPVCSCPIPPLLLLLPTTTLLYSTTTTLANLWSSRHSSYELCFI